MFAGVALAMREVPLELLGRHRSPGRSERIELERAVSPSDDLLRLFGEHLRGALALIPTIGVDRQGFVVLKQRKTGILVSVNRVECGGLSKGHLD